MIKWFTSDRVMRVLTPILAVMWGGFALENLLSGDWAFFVIEAFLSAVYLAVWITNKDKWYP